MFVVKSDKQLDCAFVLLDYYERGLISDHPDYELVLSNYREVLNAICDYLMVRL